ncbi:DUF6794 domain-containing protein [Adhaeribacter terreus]|uniref:DUF6794 domain-containing protein n=1 Tax=Adhaeribacter terreus TaxID=529703 RepID=A0ABW0EHF9_9BACT
MKYILLFILLFSFFTAFGQESAKKGINYKPINLEEAVNQLKNIHHDTTKQKIFKMTESEFLAGSHMGLGMWMRNNWGLWKGKELAKYFNSIGIFHPDDMSGIILTSYYRELHEQNWKVEEQVQHYQDFWKKSNEHLIRLETHPFYKKMMEEKLDSIEKARLDQKKSDWTSGKKISGYVEQRCGFLLKGMFLRTQIEGTIIGWQSDKLVLHIDNFVDKKKKKRVMKCYDVKDDIILIEDHELFSLIEK